MTLESLCATRLRQKTTANLFVYIARDFANGELFFINYKQIMENPDISTTGEVPICFSFFMTQHINIFR